MRSLVRYRSWVLAAGVSLWPALASAEDAVRPYPACDRTPTPVTSPPPRERRSRQRSSTRPTTTSDHVLEDAYRRDCTAHPLF